MSARCGLAQWFTIFNRRPAAALRLLCFPYAGATAAIFRLWHATLPEQVEVVGVQLPGRAARHSERPITDWAQLVPELSAALSSLYDRPLVLFGHSFGALVAFEMARCLRRSWSIVPARLLVSGRRAPHVPDDGPTTWDKSDDEIRERLRELNGTPSEIVESIELFHALLPQLRADFKLVDTYRYVPDAPLSCGITAFGGRDDAERQEGRLEAWGEHTSDDFTKVVFDGDHFFLHSQERAVLDAVRSALLRAMPSARRQPTPAPTAVSQHRRW